MSSSNYCFLTYMWISQEAGQVVWNSHLLRNCPQFVVIHTVKCFGIVNKAEVDIFLEFSCFFNDPEDADDLISGFSTCSNSSLNIWKFMVNVLLKPGLGNFEHYFARMWYEGNYAVVWAFFCVAFLWNWNENWPFSVLCHCWVFQICWHIECSTFTASSFRTWNGLTGIPSPPLALLVPMLLKARLTSHSRMSGPRWVITPLWLSGSWRSFFVQFSCVLLPYLLNIFCFCYFQTISVLYCAHLCVRCPLVSLISKCSSASFVAWHWRLNYISPNLSSCMFLFTRDFYESQSKAAAI